MALGTPVHSPEEVALLGQPQLEDDLECPPALGLGAHEERHREVVVLVPELR